MSTKAKLAMLLAVGVLVYFVLGRDAEPVEVTVENGQKETAKATN